MTERYIAALHGTTAALLGSLLFGDNLFFGKRWFDKRAER
jgi:hypothetical protein